MKYENKIKLDIINSLIMVAGIKGFVDSNYKTKTSKLLKEKSWDNAILIISDTSDTSKLIIEISVAISFDVKAKDLCLRIDKLVNMILKKHNKKLKSLKIYIRKII